MHFPSNETLHFVNYCCIMVLNHVLKECFDNMSLGDMIYHLRSTHKDSQNSLANKLNFTRQTVSKWENDVSQPDFETLKKIADIYRVDISYFETQLKEKTNTPKPLIDTNSLSFHLYMMLFTGLLVYFAGPFSLLTTLPCLSISIKRRNILLIIIYSIFLILGVSVLLSIMVPSLVPHKITITPEG